MAKLEAIASTLAVATEIGQVGLRRVKLLKGILEDIENYTTSGQHMSEEFKANFVAMFGPAAVDDEVYISTVLGEALAKIRDRGVI